MISKTPQAYPLQQQTFIKPKQIQKQPVHFLHSRNRKYTEMMGFQTTHCTFYKIQIQSPNLSSALQKTILNQEQTPFHNQNKTVPSLQNFGTAGQQFYRQKTNGCNGSDKCCEKAGFCCVETPDTFNFENRGGKQLKIQGTFSEFEEDWESRFIGNGQQRPRNEEKDVSEREDIGRMDQV